MQSESYEMHLHFLSYNDNIKKGSSKNLSILFLPISMFHAIILLISAQKFCWFTVYEVYKMVCNISVSQNGSESHLKLDGGMKKYKENENLPFLVGGRLDHTFSCKS